MNTDELKSKLPIEIEIDGDYYILLENLYGDYYSLFLYNQYMSVPMLVRKIRDYNITEMDGRYYYSEG